MAPKPIALKKAKLGVGKSISQKLEQRIELLERKQREQHTSMASLGARVRLLEKVVETEKSKTAGPPVRPPKPPSPSQSSLKSRKPIIYLYPPIPDGSIRRAVACKGQ